MFSKCCVVSCDSKRNNVPLFRFPSTEIGLNKWLQCLNCERLRNLRKVELLKHYVCRKHFEKRFLSSTRQRSRLRPGAYPSLFTDSEIQSGTPLTAQIDHFTGDNEHSYARKRQHEDHTYCQMEILLKRTRTTTEISVVEVRPSDLQSFASSNSKLLLDQPSSSSLPCRHNESIKSVGDNEHSYEKKQQNEDHTYCQTEILQKRMQTTEIESDPSERHTLVVLKSNLRLDPPSSPSLPHCHNENVTSVTRDPVPSTPKLLVRKKRIIPKKIALSPNCSKLYREYVKSRKQLDFSKRVQRALKFTKEKTFDKLTQSMNPIAKKIIWMQIKQCTKKSRGRRFSDEEKLIALSILKQSPKCYRFLHKIFILPSKQTLNKMIGKLNIEPGISAQVLQAVQHEVESWQENKKYCSILFDEVCLEAALTYDASNDRINGLVELSEKTSDYADHALVFMLRGAIYKWQQPLAYYFCKGATSGQELKSIIKKVVTAVGNTGLLPIALVSDQGTSFQSAIRSLKNDTKREQILSGAKIDDIIVINGHELSVVYDPPHLIKGIRNNFLTKDINYNNKVSKWNDIVEVYKTDCNHAQMRLLYKLNDEHVIPAKIKKMKVKNCTRVLSKTVAATLSYTAQFSQYADGTPVSPTLRNTAEMVSFFDDLFDSVNGASLNCKNYGKPLRSATTDNSLHMKFWEEAIEKLEKISFIDNKTNKDTSVPTLKNWVTTLKSFQRLWKFFQTKKIKIMRPRYFNSDPIENFFGQVRAYNYRNNDPTCQTFKNTFKSLLITRFIKFHSENYNCEDDSAEQLVKLKTLFQSNQQNSIVPDDGSAGSSNIQRLNITNIPTTAARERLHVHSRAYTTGWVIRKILKKYICTQCEANLASKENQNDHNSINNWISFKEFKNMKQMKLTYPSESAVRCFGEIIKATNDYLEMKPYQNNILKEIKNNILERDLFKFLECSKHKAVVQECFIQFTIKLTVFNWCNIINKILKGTDVSRLENKILPPMQKKAYDKYKTKLKNKRINK